jgi:hypothetical protein
MGQGVSISVAEGTLLIFAEGESIREMTHE